MLPRRDFLRLIPAGCAALLAACRTSSDGAGTIPGRLRNPEPLAGHLLRRPRSEHVLPPPSGPLLDAVVIGGGVSGLCAAWKLQRAGVERLRLFELEDGLGGTSLAEQGAEPPLPWGAHYINIPPREADCIHELLGDLGVIVGYDAAGRPLVAPGCLLRWPHERLLLDGRWHEGLDPAADAPRSEREVLQAFADDMLRWTLYRGRDDRRAFAMPLRYSTADERVRCLDRITMRAYLRQQGWQSARLDWLVDHACCDDYGATAAAVSAWAGIHYWACRYYDYRVRDEYPPDTLTWPSGNGQLVADLARRLPPDRWRTGCPVLRVAVDGAETRVTYLQLASGALTTVRARTVVYAAKLHTAPWVVSGMPAEQRRALEALDYAPWLVAAVHLRAAPREAGVGMAWDNVVYGGPSLGYVRADHQRPRDDGRMVLLYYRAFTEEESHARRLLLTQTQRFWATRILAELRAIHPDVDGLAERIDVFRWGHGMVRPRPGLLWGPGQAWREQPLGGLCFASCDVTGLPLFEEAAFAGIAAAERCLDRLGVAYDTSLGGLRA